MHVVGVMLYFRLLVSVLTDIPSKLHMLGNSSSIYGDLVHFLIVGLIAVNLLVPSSNMFAYKFIRTISQTFPFSCLINHQDPLDLSDGFL